MPPPRLTLLDLPLDIWHLIVGGLEDPHIRHDIKNLRLTCRALSQVASPYLFPTLQVDLSQASLDRAAHIAADPFLASGVRKVTAVLAYRPADVAHDFDAFRHNRMVLLEYMYGDFFSKCSPRVRNVNAGSALPEQDWLDMLFRFRCLFHAVGLKLFAPVNGESGALVGDLDISKFSAELTAESGEERLVSRFRHEIEVAYQEFCKAHEEQLNLVTDPRESGFVPQLVASMAKFPNLDKGLELASESSDLVPLSANWSNNVSSEAALSLMSSFKPLQPSNTGANDDASCHENDEKKKDHCQWTFRSILTSPLAWETITAKPQRPPIGELPPARILSELPIALHLAGVRLRELSIRTWPNVEDYPSSLILPPPTSPFFPEWETNLSWACASLGKFDFRPRMPEETGLYGPCSDSQHRIEQYLSAILSGPMLENVRLEFCAFELATLEDQPELFFDVEKVIRSMTLAGSGLERQATRNGHLKIKKFTLSHASLTQTTLERFLSSQRIQLPGETTGPGQIRVCLTDVALLSEIDYYGDPGTSSTEPMHCPAYYESCFRHNDDDRDNGMPRSGEQGDRQVQHAAAPPASWDPIRQILNLQDGEDTRFSDRRIVPLLAGKYWDERWNKLPRPLLIDDGHPFWG